MHKAVFLENPCLEKTFPRAQISPDLLRFPKKECLESVIFGRVCSAPQSAKRVRKPSCEEASISWLVTPQKPS